MTDLELDGSLRVEPLEQKGLDALRFQEIEHRLGNIFGLFNALILICERSSDSIEQFASDLRSRVTALAKAQALGMEDGQESDVSLRELLEQLVLPFTDADLAEAMTGPEISLAGNSAAALALAVHELVTNAVKYGGLADGRANLRISWQFEADGGLCINWAEAGTAGRSDGGNGFGSQLIHDIFEQQLSGWAEVGFDTAGFTGRFKLGPFHLRTGEDADARTHSTASELTTEEIEHCLAGHRVLIVEDDPIIAMDIEEIARSLGASDIATAYSITDAENALETYTPSVALIDLSLPDGKADGLVRRNLESGVRTIAISGSVARRKIEAEQDVVLLQKPFSRQSLAEVIARAGTVCLS